MTAPNSFALQDGIAIWKPPEGGLGRTVRRITSAIEAARRQGLRKLLIVVPGTWFDSPSVAARHEMAREWAAAAEGMVRLAFVVPAEMIDPQKLGVVVAKNFGTDANVFANEAQALDWLRGG